MRNLLIIFSLLYLISCTSGKGAPNPIAINGQMDLSGWDFKTNGDVKLIGEWEFYWKEFLTPADLKTEKYLARKKVFISLPNTWNRFVEARKHSYMGETGQGFGTYVLRLKGVDPELRCRLLLKLKESYSAYRLYFVPEDNLNSGIKPVAANGVIGRSKDEEISQRYPQISKVCDISETNYIIVQVSNFTVFSGGLFKTISLGIEKNLLLSYVKDHLLSIVTLAVLLTMALYHLGLFAERREDKVSLIFSLVCLSILFRMVLTERYIIEVYGEPVAGLMKNLLRLEFATVFIGPPLVYTFFYMVFKAEFSKLWLKIFWSASVLYLILTAVFSLKFIINHVIYYQLIIFITGILTIYGSIRAAMFKRVGARTALLGFGVMFACAINDILYSQWIIKTMFLTHYGTLALVFAQSYILSKKFARAYRTAEHLGENLKSEVRAQTLRLEEKNKELNELDKQKTRFFQNVSHELRTPLTLVLNPLKELSAKFKDNNEISMVHNNSKRLYRLVNQLLDFQKISHEGHKLSLSQINIADFVSVIANNFKSACSEKEIRLSVSKEYNNEILIMGEVDALEKVVFNYLSNAFKYTPKGGKIEIKLSESENIIKLSVRDTGPGISKDAQKKLFTVFSQVDDSTLKKHEGSGLGLALVKELSEEMNAEVGVESEVGMGSEFWITFPVHKKEKMVIDFLILDDEETIRSFLSDFLMIRFPNRTLLTAENAAEGREYINEYTVKCVLSDIHMPGENGIDFLSHVSVVQPNCKRLLMTAKADVDLLQKAINESQISSVLYKPFTSNEEVYSTLLKYLTEYDEELAGEEVIDISDYKPKDWHLDEGSEHFKKLELEEAEVPQTRDETVLVVDDIAEMRALIAKSVRRLGFKVITAENGEEALSVAKEAKPDLIITDWMMPVMSGLELVEKLKEDPELVSIPTVMLTAKSDEESRMLSGKAGASAYLGKPFDDLEISSVVENLLRLKLKENEVKDLNRMLTENVLKRFLPPNIVTSIIEESKTIDSDPALKNITVLFADLCKFTALSRELGPRKMSMVLNEYLSEMTEIIFSYGGTIDKFIGDSIMVIFGAPVQQESGEQIKRATECSVKMQEKMLELNSNWKSNDLPEFQIRVGMHHGPAVVGYFGGEKRVDYTAIGNTVNLASRVESIAGAGQIFVTEQVRDLMGDLPWICAGKFDLKGVKSSLDLYRIDIENAIKFLK